MQEFILEDQCSDQPCSSIQCLFTFIFSFKSDKYRLQRNVSGIVLVYRILVNLSTGSNFSKNRFGIGA